MIVVVLMFVVVAFVVVSGVVVRGTLRRHRALLIVRLVIAHWRVVVMFRVCRRNLTVKFRVRVM